MKIGDKVTFKRIENRVGGPIFFETPATILNLPVLVARNGFAPPLPSAVIQFKSAGGFFKRQKVKLTDLVERKDS